MTLIETDDYSGYLVEDIKYLLGPKYEDFAAWFNGQTGVVHEGKLLVYAWDWERWLRGLAAND